MMVSRKKYQWPFMAGLVFMFLFGGFVSFVTAVRICDSDTCNRMSAEIHSTMNTSVDPCENFFQYACGGWIAAHLLPEGYDRFSQLHVMHQELQAQLRGLLEEPIKPTDNAGERAAKQQFQSCMNETASDQDSMEKLLSIIQHVGSWPTLHNPGTHRETWQEIHDEYNRMTGKPSLYAVTIHANRTRSSVNSIFLDQPDSIFDARLQRKTAMDVIKYVNFLTNVVKDFATAAGTSVTDDEIKIDVINVYNFRDKLEKLRTQFIYRRRGPIMSIDQAQNYLNNATYCMQQFDIFAAIQAAYSNVKDVTISVDEMIHVREPKYLKGLVKLLANTPVNVILNHIHLHFVENHLPHASTEHTRILAELYGPQDDRVTYCINMPNIQVALSSLYVKRYFSAEQRAAAVEIVENVKNAIKRQMRRTDWLNPVALNFSLNKIEKLEQIIGYTDAIVNDTKVEAYYAEYNMSGDYLQNILNYEEVKYTRLLTTLRHRTRGVLKMQPQAWPIKMLSLYRAIQNRFEITASLLRWPYFNSNLPNVANYAAIGTAVGHTLASMYDIVGYYLDQRGNYVVRISPESDKAHDNRTWCFEEQYSDFARDFLNGTGIKYDDRNSFLVQTTYESFGLSAALEAYEAITSSEGDEFKILPNLSDYNQNRQFFLAFANSQCETVDSGKLYDMIQNSRATIAELKVNFAVSNLAVFSNTFNCPLGSPMNPVKKCAIFDPPPM